MQRVIGLDIGSYSIKAVEIVHTLKTYEIVGFYENIVPHLDEVPIDAIAPSCMEQLFKENRLEADRIVTAMPGQFISSRVLNFPFSDPTKIEEAVFSSIEGAVPFDMDDMIWNHQILGAQPDKSTNVLAVMTRKAFLKNFLDLLQRINIDPKIVDIDSLAFYNLATYMPAHPGDSIAMVDIGHEKSSVCIVRDGVLRMFRSINLGGRYITEFLARDLEVSFAQAQRIKHQVSRIFCSEDNGNGLSADERLIVERMTLATNAIVKELGRTFYAFKTWEKSPLSCVYLSGGTSRITNLEQFIKDQLEVECIPCRFQNTDLKINADLDAFEKIIPQSVAIGVRTVSNKKKTSQINLRTGEFAFVQNYESIIGFAFKASRVAAFVALLLTFSYGVKYYFYQKHISNLNEQYRKEYAAMSVQNSKKYDGKQDFVRYTKDVEKSLRSQISGMNTAIENFKSENAANGPLFLLRDISAGIPKETKLDVTLYEYKSTESGDGKLVFKAETEGYATQAAVIESLKKVSTLTNVVEKQSGAKPGSNGKVVEFTVNADYPVAKNKAAKKG